MSPRQRRSEHVPTCEKGKAGHNLIGKRGHQAVCRAGLGKDVTERYLLPSNLENLSVREDYAIGASACVIYIPLCGVYISRRGPTGCLSSNKAISRARRWDKRVQATHVFFISISLTSIHVEPGVAARHNFMKKGYEAQLWKWIKQET